MKKDMVITRKTSTENSKFMCDAIAYSRPALTESRSSPTLDLCHIQKFPSCWSQHPQVAPEWS